MASAVRWTIFTRGVGFSASDIDISSSWIVFLTCPDRSGPQRSATATNLSRDRDFRDLAGAWETLDAPAGFDHPLDHGKRKDAVRKVGERGFELFVRHRNFDAADRMRDEAMQRPPVLQRDRHVDLGRIDPRRDDRGYLSAQRDDRGIVDRAIAKLLLSAGALDKRDRNGVIDAELAFEAIVRTWLAGEFEHQRIHLELHALELIRGKLVFVAQLNGGVDRRMHHDPAGERLVRVAQGLVAAPEIVQNLAIILLGADRIRPAPLGFYHLVRGGEVLRRQQARENAVARGPSRIEALVHRSEGLAQAHRLRRCEAERPDHLL